MNIKNTSIKSLVGITAIVASCSTKDIIVDGKDYEVTKKKDRTTIETGTYFAKTIIDMKNDGIVDFYTLVVDYPDAEEITEYNYGKNIPQEIQDEFTKVMVEYNKLKK